MPDTAIEAILREWDLQEHDPPNSDIREWIRTIEQLCDTYGIPGTQRPQCATRFVKGGLRARLESVLKDARTQVGPILWAQFANFMVSLDHRLDSIVIGLLLIGFLQINFKNGRVSAPFITTLWSSLVRSSKQNFHSTKITQTGSQVPPCFSPALPCWPRQRYLVPSLLWVLPLLALLRVI